MKKNNSEETFFVHRLVAEAFVPNPNKFKFVAHKDGDLTNNNADNLEWVESGGDEDLLKEPVGPTFTPGEDFDDEMEDFERWLAEDRESKQHIDMSDDDINLLSEDEKTALIKSQAQLIRKLQDTIDWYEADEEESGHE